MTINYCFSMKSRIKANGLQIKMIKSYCVHFEKVIIAKADKIESKKFAN